MAIKECRYCGKKNPTQYHVNSCKQKETDKKLEETEKKLAEALNNNSHPMGQKPQEPPQTKEPVRVKKKEPEQPPQDDKVICDSCESEIQGTPKFCPNCGVELAW